jgi:hypothetical protein
MQSLVYIGITVGAKDVVASRALKTQNLFSFGCLSFLDVKRFNGGSNQLETTEATSIKV